METKQTLNLSYEFSGSLFEKYRNGEWWCNDFDIEGNETSVNIDYQGYAF